MSSREKAGGDRGGQPEFKQALHASIEPRQRRSVTGQHAMSEPHRPVGKEPGSQPAIDLAPYGLALPGCSQHPNKSGA